MKRSSTTLSACLLALAVVGASIAHEPVKVPKVAALWTFAESGRGSSVGDVCTATDLIQNHSEEMAGYEVVSDALALAARCESGCPKRPNTIEDPSQLPLLPSANQLLELGKKVGVDFVSAGTLSWRVRSIWVGLGP